MISIPLALSLLITAIVLGGIRTFMNFQKGFGITNIFTLYYLFVLVDIFIPALSMLLTGEMPLKGSHIPIFSREEVAYGSIIAVVSFAFIYVGYVLTISIFNKKSQASFRSVRLHYSRTIFLLIFMVTAFLITQFDTINRLGGPVEFFLSMVKERRSVAFSNETVASEFITTILGVSREISMGLCAIIFAERNQLGLRKSAWLILGLGLLLSLTSFYRGTILIYGLMLIASQQLTFQKYSLNVSNYQPEKFFKYIKRQKRKLINIFILILILMTIFGSYRNVFYSKGWDNTMSQTEGFKKEFDRVIEGAGLYSIVNIVDSFPAKAPFLEGSSIINQALRFIPRSIYPNKPLTYGAVEITDALGYPPTGDPVTPVGEAWANFGFLGIPLTTFFGFLFGIIEIMRFRGYFQYLYVTVGVTIVLEVSWFAFTGFMSWLPSVILFGLLIPFIVKTKRYS